MGEIKDSDRNEVDTLLKDVFLVKDDKLRESFVTIALFMSDVNKFKAAFNGVSELLRKKYNAIAARDNRSNVLTRAIFEAASEYGFAVQENVVFAGFISPTDITKDYIAKAVLWKDGVGSQHGEYSHSLQWLTIGQSGIFGTHLAEVYSKTVAYKANRDFARPGRIETARPYVWDFLVDCFSHNLEPDFKTNIVSRTPRSPSAFTHFLFVEWKHLWISALIRDRYERKNLQIPLRNAPDTEEDLKTRTDQQHKGGLKGYVARESKPGVIYSRAITAQSERMRTTRGLERRKGVIDSQTWGSTAKYPAVIKDDQTQQKYKVLEHEAKLYGKPENIVGDKVMFEIWGDSTGGITYGWS